MNHFRTFNISLTISCSQALDHVNHPSFLEDAALRMTLTFPRYARDDRALSPIIFFAKQRSGSGVNPHLNAMVTNSKSSVSRDWTRTKHKLPGHADTHQDCDNEKVLVGRWFVIPFPFLL